MKTDKAIDIPDPPESIEGIGTPDDEPAADYPLDVILIRNESRTIYEVVRRINGGSYVMDPDFQRDFVWSDAKQSKLVESVLMRIPLPVFYIAEDEQGKMVVVDGLQRLSTFKRFLNNELALRLIDKDLKDKRFQDLPPKLQNRIEDCNLIFYIIDPKVPERTRLDIFDRVNGGEPLSRQQMRNCLYQGPATRFLKSQASSELFLEATGHSVRSDDMRDRELVNRYLSFQVLPIDSYRGDMDVFLAEGLKKVNKSPELLTFLAEGLQQSLRNNLNLFDKHAFRKHVEKQTARKPINVSLWEVLSTGLAPYPPLDVLIKKESLLAEFYALFEDQDFFYSISFSTNSTKNVVERFTAVRELLRQVLGDPPN